jgi:hypothetical protein
MCAQEHRADVRQHAIGTARTALGQWWQSELGPSWWEILADPGTRADALWRAAAVLVQAVEPIMEEGCHDAIRCGELQRERDFFAGQAEAMRTQLERVLAERIVFEPMAPQLAEAGRIHARGA